MIWIVVAIVAALILFALGYYLGRAPVAGLRTQAAQAQAALQTQTTQAQQALAGAQLRANVQSARAYLYQSAADLDLRNFGTANGDLKAAAQNMQQVVDRLGTAGLPSDVAGQLQKLQQQVSGTNLSVAVNLQQQRDQVLAYAKQATQLAGQLPAGQ